MYVCFALTYFDTPLIQSKIQRVNHIATVVSKLTVAAQLHATRSLSVLGRATVINTLILSKCWYILRVTPLTQQDLQKITSVAIQFLKRGIFPILPWSTWTLPKIKGGLGVLNVTAQYSALYFHWIQPLLTTSSHVTTTDPLHSMLIHYVNNINRSAHHQIPLLLPSSTRSFTRKGRVATIDIIYQSLDSIPRNYDTVQINHTTALHLPLQTVLFTHPSSQFRIPPKIKDMIVSDVFQYNADGQFLHWKDPQDSTLRYWKQAPAKLFRGIQAGDLQLQPFFQPLCNPCELSHSTSTSSSTVDFTPFALHLEFLKGATVLSKISTKTFCQACSATFVPACLSSISSDSWTLFWGFSLNDGTEKCSIPFY